MNKEYFSFKNSPSVPPPPHIKNSILKNIQSSMIPLKTHLVFLKLFIVQLFSGSVTMTVCPQFGLGPIGGGHGISHYFMEIGAWACAIFCAMFFFSVSSLSSAFVLRREEILFITRRNYITWILVLSIFLFLSMMGYSIAGYDAMFFSTQYILIWLLFGYISAQTILKLRNNLIA